jgi:hypothetical protein
MIYTNPLHQSGPVPVPVPVPALAQQQQQQQQQHQIIIYAALLPNYKKTFFLHLLCIIMLVFISIGIAYLVDGSFRNWELAVYMSMTILCGVYLVLCCAHYVCRREEVIEGGLEIV